MLQTSLFHLTEVKTTGQIIFFIHFTVSIGSRVYGDTTWLSRSENKFLQKCKLLGKTQAPAGCSQITELVSRIQATMVFFFFFCKICVWYSARHVTFMGLNVLKNWMWDFIIWYIFAERTGIKSNHCWIKSLHPCSPRSGPASQMKTELSLSMWWIAFLWELSLSVCPFLPSVSHQLGLLLSHPAIMS